MSKSPESTKEPIHLYLVRHCVTDYNISGQFQGSLDISLNQLGYQQAHCLAGRFADIKIDRIYSSPLLRARQTAEAIAESHRLTVEITEGLREINAGKFEGRLAAENKRDYPTEFYNMKFALARFNPPAGESFRNLYVRVSGTVKEILQTRHQTHVLIITHYFPSSVITGMAEGLDWSQSHPIMTQNASISLYEYDRISGLHPVYAGDVAHLRSPDGTNYLSDSISQFAQE